MGLAGVKNQIISLHLNRIKAGNLAFWVRYLDRL